MHRLFAAVLIAVSASFLPADLLGSGSNTVAAAEVVHYQCKEWKAKHIHDTKKIETIAATLKKLGCEVKQEKHNGHVDLKYRCPKERSLPVKSHDEAVKWEKWLKEFGFKAYHTH
ncbi:hypothetical protein U8335_22965 [Roseiconus lacunae]|uniref:hypothetical protein n=1 Tax=Roseiconus lacunae TaxID=2605694 RepID=UPI00308B3026|nr:hypothetical protein U8335_22965 [Stieleria sp. HD01]